MQPVLDLELSSGFFLVFSLVSRLWLFYKALIACSGLDFGFWISSGSFILLALLFCLVWSLDLGQFWLFYYLGSSILLKIGLEFGFRY